MSKRSKIHRDEQGEFRWETYFVGGKQKREKVRMLDGKDFDSLDYLRANADDIWLHQHGEHEILHEREAERKKVEDQGAESGEEAEDPF